MVRQVLRFPSGERRIALQMPATGQSLNEGKFSCRPRYVFAALISRTARGIWWSRRVKSLSWRSGASRRFPWSQRTAALTDWTKDAADEAQRSTAAFRTVPRWPEPAAIESAAGYRARGFGLTKASEIGSRGRSRPRSAGQAVELAERLVAVTGNECGPTVARQLNPRTAAEKPASGEAPTLSRAHRFRS